MNAAQAAPKRRRQPDPDMFDVTHARQRLHVHRFRLSVLTFATQHECQVTYARQRVWMLTPKHGLVQRQRLPVHRFRNLVLALTIKHERQVTHTRQRALDTLGALHPCQSVYG
jgi:hypothetical protein